MPVTGRLCARDELCRDCQACVLGCSLLHEGVCGPTLARLSVAKDMVRYTFKLTVCEHCDDPECLAACPTGAIALDPRGVAILDEDACVRCSACFEACAYGAIVRVPPSAESDARFLKCDLCAGRAEGPVCVELCPVGALTLVESVG